MNPRKKHEERPQAAPVTADQIQKNVQAAKSLASIPDQQLLENPALNPQTRARYDELTAARLQEELDLIHARKLRSAQEADRREGEQADIDRAIAAARKATSPARTVVDMTRHQARFGRVALAASLALSVGSAMGMAALVGANDGPIAVGYLAEVGLTGLSTTVIVWRGILARAGAAIEKATLKLFAVLVVVPLLVSIVGSSLGSGPVGAACSVGSALFAGLAYLINTSASAAIGQAIAKIDRGEARSADTSKAPHEPAHTGERRPSALPRRRAGDGLAVVGDAIADEASDYLRSHGFPSERDRSHEEMDRSHGETEEDDDHAESQAKQSERLPEHDRSHEDAESTERVLTVQERQRLEKQHRIRRIAEYLRAHPGAQTGEVATELRLGESTVRRLRREIEDGGTP